MNVAEFKSRHHNNLQIYSGQIVNKFKLKVYVDRFKRQWSIRDNMEEGVNVYFKNIFTDGEEGCLTIFETALLYTTFVKYAKMGDEGGFFKCVYGKKFVESIEQVEVVKRIDDPQFRIAEVIV